MGKKSKKLWYRNGLRFECTQCGQCCTGSPGVVQFNEDEGRGMAAQLDLTFQEFLNRYAVEGEEEGLWELLDRESPEGFDCILLGRCAESGTTWCTVHRNRPLQCRTWPFWPDNLTNKKAWQKAGHACEGIGRGELIPLRVIERERKATPDWGRTP